MSAYSGTRLDRKSIDAIIDSGYVGDYTAAIDLAGAGPAIVSAGILSGRAFEDIEFDVDEDDLNSKWSFAKVAKIAASFKEKSDVFSSITSLITKFFSKKNRHDATLHESNRFEWNPRSVLKEKFGWREGKALRFAVGDPVIKLFFETARKLGTAKRGPEFGNSCYDYVEGLTDLDFFYEDAFNQDIFPGTTSEIGYDRARTAFEAIGVLLDMAYDRGHRGGKYWFNILHIGVGRFIAYRLHLIYPVPIPELDPDPPFELTERLIFKR